MRERTTELMEMNVDLEKEQSAKINFGDFSMLIFKTYPQFRNEKPKSRREAIYRLYQKRLHKGICRVFGCPNKAKKGLKACKFHLELDRMSHKRVI